MNGHFDRIMKVAERPPVAMVKGAGSWLWDRDGKRYLDFVQGWAVNCLGHSPPVVLEALTAQAAQLINCSPAYYNEPLAKLADLLAEASVTQKGFLQTVVATGLYLADRLRAIARELGHGEVRGRGLLVALEIRGRDAKKVAAAALDHGLLINAPRPDALRLTRC